MKQPVLLVTTFLIMLLALPAFVAPTDALQLIDNQGSADFVPGDTNGSGRFNVADVVYLIAYLFKGGPPPEPYLAGDVDCDEWVNVADLSYSINAIFRGGPPPCGL